MGKNILKFDSVFKSLDTRKQFCVFSTLTYTFTFVQYFRLILYKNLIDPRLHIPLFDLRIYDLH